MAKKSTKTSKRRSNNMSSSFVREFKALAARHGVRNAIVGQMKAASAAAAAVACPEGTTLKRVTFKDEFGNTITKDICV